MKVKFCDRIVKFQEFVVMVGRFYQSTLDKHIQYLLVVIPEPIKPNYFKTIQIKTSIFHLQIWISSHWDLVVILLLYDKIPEEQKMSAWSLFKSATWLVCFYFFTFWCDAIISVSKYFHLFAVCVPDQQVKIQLSKTHFVETVIHVIREKLARRLVGFIAMKMLIILQINHQTF